MSVLPPPIQAGSSPANKTAAGTPAISSGNGSNPGALRRVLVAASFFGALIVLWALVVQRLPARERVLLPPPSEVARYLAESARNGDLWHATVITMRRLATGYIMGVLIGLPLGVITARYRWAKDTIGVLGLGLQTLPSVCWVPLAILWFGQTETSMLFVVVMGTLWSVQLAVDNGVRNVPPIYARAARTMGSRGMHTWLRVILPASLPFIVSGVKQGWAFAWRSLMAAEINVTILTGFGLGQLLEYGRDAHAMNQVIGTMLLIVVIGLLADRILFSPFESFLHRRWGTTRT
jgi:NitT/TauT family transport system permease protein